MNNHKLRVFSGRANLPLAEAISRCLGDPPGKVALGNYPDGETSVRIDEDVRGRDVFIVQPTCPDVNQNLMELLVLVDTFRRASAGRINAVIPYYGYARQDRKDVGRVPITAKLVANLLTTAGVNRVIALDLHAAQIQGFFDIPVDHLQASPVLNEFVGGLGIAPRDLVILSPDEGNVKRADRHRKKLGGTLAIIDKRRVSATEVQQQNLIGGPIDGKVCVIFDDLISTARTIVGAATVAKRNGAKEIYCCATHALLVNPAIELLRDAPLTKIIITDSIPLPPHKRLSNIHVLSVAPLLADAIKRIHANESVSALFE